MTNKSISHQREQNDVNLRRTIKLKFFLSILSPTMIALFLVLSGTEETQTHLNCILSILLKSSMVEKVIYHLNRLSFSLPVSNCVSLSPSSRQEWAGVRLWPQEAVNSLENGRCLMGRRAGPPPTHKPPQNDP